MKYVIGFFASRALGILACPPLVGTVLNAMVKGIRAVVTAAVLKVCRLIRRDDNAKPAGRAAGIGTPESAISPCVASRVYGISCEVVFGTWNHNLASLLGLGDGLRQRHRVYHT